MRKSLLTSVSVAAFMLGASAAKAADFSAPAEPARPGSYFSLFGGLTVASDFAFVYGSYVYDTSFKNGFTVGGAYGEYLTPSLRGELEISYQRYSSDTYTYLDGDPADPADGHVSQVNVMLNLWKDIDLGTSFMPYVGAGLGVGVGDMSINWDSDTWSSNGSNAGIATQLGTGVRIPVSDRVMVDVGYRFRSLFGVVGVDVPDEQYFSFAHYYNHTFQAGVSYAMGPGFVEPVADMEAYGSDAYFSLFGGVAIPEATGTVQEDTYVYKLENKTGFTVGAAVGTSVAPGLRAELEASYTKYAHDNYTYEGQQDPVDAEGDSALFMVMANLWKDIPLGMAAPYLGGGVGVGIVDSHGSTHDAWDDTRVGMALQMGAGVRFGVADNLSVDLGYRAKGVLGVTLQGSDGDYHAVASFLTHTAQVGVTYGGGAYVQPAAYSGSGAYVSLFGGAVEAADTAIAYSDDYIYDISFKTGFTVGAAVGTQLLETVRGELEVAYLEIDSTCGEYEGEGSCSTSWEGEVSAVTIMTNVWKDFHMGVFSPYVGGGVGVALFTPEIPDWEDTNLAMAAQVGAGVRMAVSDNVTLDAGYRFKGILDPLWTGKSLGTDDHGMGSLYTHNFQGGASWGF